MPPIIIIIMSEFKVGGTYICTTEQCAVHIICIIRYFIVTQYLIGSLGDIMQLKKIKNKIKPKTSNNPKIKIEL